MSAVQLVAAFTRGGTGDPDGGAPVASRAIVHRAAALAARMPPSAPGSEVAFAFGHDRLAFAVALVATWMRGHTAVLPEDASRERVTPLLERPGHVLLVHDTGVGRGLFVPRFLEEPDATPEVRPAPFPADRPAVVAVRGQAFAVPTVVRAGAAELLARVDALAARLELLPDDAVVSTLTPTALPGCLAGVLVPLRVGGRFARSVPPDPAAAAASARRGGCAVLVASAAHARALAALPAGALGATRVLACVDEDPGARCAALLAERHDVRSMCVAELSPAEPPGAGPALRHALLALAGVHDAAVVEVPEPAGPVALVGVSADEGQRDAVAALVAGRLERASCRELRWLAAIPRDANGRTDATAFLLQFGRGRSGRPLVRELRWTEVGDGDRDVRRYRTRIPETYAFLEGHFPGHPVLAGATQLGELVLPCVRRLRPELGPLERLARVKFQAPLAPGDEVEVVLRPGAGTHELAFAVQRAGTTCAHGRMRFQSRGGDA